MLRIKEVAKEKGFTITGLADKLGMTQISLSRIINGNPTVETLQKIGDALGVEVVTLFIPPRKDDSESLYIKRDGEMVKVGEISLSK